jgi:hypothetical protein
MSRLCGLGLVETLGNRFDLLGVTGFDLTHPGGLLIPARFTSSV